MTAALVCASGNTILHASGKRSRIVLSVIGSLTYAFTPLIWEYSITAEVFAMNNFLCALLLYILCSLLAIIVGTNASISLGKDEERSVLYLSISGGLCCGLALANQHSSLLMVAYVVPCVLIAVWICTRSLFVSVLIRAALGFLAAFSTYFYLPWAAQVPTHGSWGNLGTVEGFVRHVLRAEYGTFRLGMIVGSETALERIIIYLQHTSGESYHLLFVVLGLSALVYGVMKMYKKVSSTTTAPHVAIKPAEKETPKKSAKGNTKGTKTSTSTGTSTEVVVTRTSPWNAGEVIVANLIAMWLFYVLIWHCVLSNLPLSAPMPFAVHSRFWMQPNIILYTLMTAGVGYVADFLGQKMPAVISVLAQVATVTVFLSIVLHQRWPEMDKSSAGDVLHAYASAKLASILPPHSANSENLDGQQLPPMQSLLLSHTDLDWNPVRYLQHCEGVGMKSSDVYKKSPFQQWRAAQMQSHPNHEMRGLVTHLSFQLIPYPWFQTTQAPLYPHVVFPPTNVAGISSDRASEGNAQMIQRFLRANGITNQSFVSHEDTTSGALTVHSAHPIFPGGVYLDMQAVNDPEIDAFGQWRGLVLVPWGTLYRVFGPLRMDKIQELHLHSYQQLRALQTRFPAVNDQYVLKFAPGSWERAAANVYYDAHYQFALNLLTFAIEAQGRVEMKILPLLLDRYHIAASVLKVTLSAVRQYGTFSSSVADLTKNTALAWMRLHALMDVVGKFRKEIRVELNKITKETIVSEVSSKVILRTSAHF